MKKIVFILLFITFLNSPIFSNPLQFAWNKNGDDEWILEDTLIQSVFVLLMAIDWKQTDKLMRIKETVPEKTYYYTDENGNTWQYTRESYTHYKYKENGLVAKHLIGEHPSRKKIALYCGSWIVGHPLIAYIFPRPLREMWQAGGIGIELYCVSGNYATEVKFGFSF